MKDTLNAELLAAEARGRKHIPFAVFAVILIHVILFVVLLVAAGCRAKARARLQQQPEPMQAAVLTNYPPEQAAEQVIATEPVVEAETVQNIQGDPGVSPVVRQPANPAQNPAATPVRQAQPEPNRVKVYEVRPGDSLALIARKHGTTIKTIKQDNNLKADFLRVGQKLKLRTPTADLAMR